MATLSLGLLQLLSRGFDQDANLAKGEDTVRQAAGMGAEEGIYLAHFDLEQLRNYREREVLGNAFRKPHRYGLLTEMDVHAPFIRVNEKGVRFPRGER
ncbi:MAG: hypothetical protein PHQ40_13185 [Anaerolineaceae bacterium]|nr:hypothetical protein [Anaerolineaceae bacterium]